MHFPFSLKFLRGICILVLAIRHRIFQLGVIFFLSWPVKSHAFVLHGVALFPLFTPDGELFFKWHRHAVNINCCKAHCTLTLVAHRAEPHRHVCAMCTGNLCGEHFVRRITP